MEHYRNPFSPQPASLTRDVGLVILRLTAGLSLLFFHALREVQDGWQFIWQKVPWSYSQSLADSNFPLPLAVACITAVGGLLLSLFIVIGFFTRASALALGLCAMVTLFLYLGLPETAEKVILYIAVYSVIFISGAGRFSIDALFGGRKKTRNHVR